MRSILIAAAGAAALFAASQAGAMTVDNSQEARAVSYKGVNFNDAQQVSNFYARLQNAARDACTEQSTDVRGSQNQRACVDRVMSQAVNGMQRPMLTAQYQAKSDKTRFATGF